MPFKAKRQVIVLPNSFRKILTKDYQNLVKQYGELMPWLIDKESIMEAAMVYYPYYFANPTIEQINNIGDKRYTEYCDLQASLRDKIEGLDFVPMFEGECILQSYGRTFQLLNIMQRFEGMFKNIGKGEQEASPYDFVRKYGAYGAVLSIVDGYGLSIKEVEQFTANQIFVNLDYLSGKNEAEKLNKQLRAANSHP